MRWNLDLVIRWLTSGESPGEEELKVFREHAQARAAEGFPPDMIPANFRRGARFARRARLEAVTDEERPALLESADLLFEYVDRVSRIFSEAYAAASEGSRVVGMSQASAPWRGLAIGRRAVIAEGPPAIGAERGHALDELRVVVQLAAARGRSGEVDAGDYLPELLLRRSPRLAPLFRCTATPCATESRASTS